ncbi:hypothetical protein BJ944DRAFT_273011, partial [Cunninghamella echinulata]
MKKSDQNKISNNTNQNNLQNPFSVSYVPGTLPETQNKTNDSNQQYLISTILNLINTVNDLQQEVHMMRQTLEQHITPMDTRMDSLSFISTNNPMSTSVSASFSTPYSASSTLKQRYPVQIARKKYEGGDRKVPKTKFLEFINDYWMPENREDITNSKSFNENAYIENIYQNIWGIAAKLMGSYLKDKPGNFTWKGIDSIVLENMIRIVNNEGERRSVPFSNCIDNWAAKVMLQKIFNNKMTYLKNKRKAGYEISTTPSATIVSKSRSYRGIRGSRNFRDRRGSNGGGSSG